MTTTNRTLVSLLALLCLSAMTAGAQAAPYSYSSTVMLCTGTCASFASLDVGSTITGTIEIDVGANDTFGDTDISAFTFSVFNPALPVSGPVGDPVNDNPLVLDFDAGIAVSNGTVGGTDAGAEINTGQMLIEFLLPPFSSNGVFLVFDLVTGNGQLCLFFVEAGCIPGATEALAFEGTFARLPESDTDEDGVTDDTDNCTLDANPLQIDSDGDGIGNVCDPDIFLPNDCHVTFLDLGAIKRAFLSNPAAPNWNPDADLVGAGNSTPDGEVNFFDLGRIKEMIFGPPGPSASGCI